MTKIDILVSCYLIEVTALCRTLSVFARSTFFKRGGFFVDIFETFVQKFPEEELTFESMKRILSPENVESRKEAEEETRMRLCETFRTASFMELVRQTQAHVSQYSGKSNKQIHGS